jgi:hypothetical protein
MMTSKTVTMPLIMACRMAPMPLTMAIRHEPIAPKTASIYKQFLSSTTEEPFQCKRGGIAYAGNDSTHCLLVYSSESDSQDTSLMEEMVV